ncbi:DUF938 domain-containing protein [Paraglaciecola arctica]|uniref:DUF938 domain-containing protein n=1 Tax=Paraglaciecola arctica TaxID=1128911 RepID=UPI001C069C15|nr:DUF938 domain-containing protein [Paraglaciecola arctica]MBU3003279.1 DUF938 domain-containing protein [Paraglaciecola arctica]
MTVDEKPFSQACENNKQPIFDVLGRVLTNRKKLLEIGSGTGQHAAYFAPRLSHLIWQTSDMPINHDAITSWLEDVPVSNLLPPISFTVGINNWPLGDFDAVYTANTTHIMQPSESKLMMQLVADGLPKGGVFCQYGPFNFQGRYTSESNAAFDQHLKEQGCGGIRDVDELVEWANSMNLIEKISMPANNFMLIWQKK